MKIIEKIKKKSENIFENESVCIAFLGDSVTQGCFEVYKTGETAIDTVYEPQNAYHSDLKKIFSVLYPNVPLNIINAGIFGDHAANAQHRVKRDVLRFSPDLVVVSFGLNDVTKDIGKIGEYTEALHSIFTQLKEDKIEVIFMTPPLMAHQVDCELADIELVRIAEDLSRLQNSGVFDQYVQAAKEVCAKDGIVVCDCYAKWKLLRNCGVNTDRLLCNRLNHPSREMHWLFAASLVETMFQM